MLARIIPHPRATAARCGCGATYTIDQWSRLRYVGEMGDGDGGVLELRDCRCGSTLARPVPGSRRRRRRVVWVAAAALAAIAGAVLWGVAL